jgi:hypothetical protein
MVDVCVVAMLLLKFVCQINVVVFSFIFVSMRLCVNVYGLSIFL